MSENPELDSWPIQPYVKAFVLVKPIREAENQKWRTRSAVEREG
jgi:hypothetical protein